MMEVPGEKVLGENTVRPDCQATGKRRLATTMEGGLALVVMGVSGCGKSTVGRLLAEQIGCQFYDADDYHSAENRDLMSRGIPLTDANRAPWLEALARILSRHLGQGEICVMACSALRRSYRDVLRKANTSNFEKPPNAQDTGGSPFMEAPTAGLEHRPQEVKEVEALPQREGAIDSSANYCCSSGVDSDESSSLAADDREKLDLGSGRWRDRGGAVQDSCDVRGESEQGGQDSCGVRRESGQRGQDSCDVRRASGRRGVEGLCDGGNRKGLGGGKSGLAGVLFVHLSGSEELFYARSVERHARGLHYMPPSLLRSQFEALEVGWDESDVIAVDASLAPQVIVDRVLVLVELK